MAFLGLFSKRDKNKAHDTATDYTASAASDHDPSEPDYVLPSSSHSHSLYMQPGASSSKLKIGFKSKKPPSATRTDSNLLSPPSSAFFSSRSESENNLVPPSRSAVFAGYNDPASAHSTRSLPTSPTSPTSHSRTTSREFVDLSSASSLPPPQKHSKGGGLFSWAHRERKKSKPPPPPTGPFVPPPLPEISLDSSDSFNLRSFRHVRPESPNDSAPAMLPPVRPRPREGSFTSDTSQRISVAAFREAQARRSAANSPVPSTSQDMLSGNSVGLRPPSTFALRNSRSLSGDSDTDDSDDDSEADATLKPRRNRSAKLQNAPPVVGPGKKSTSELGHQMVRAYAPPMPRMTASASTSSSFAQNGPSPKESVDARPRASASTSALQPNAAARRASLLVAEQQQQSSQRTQPQVQSKIANPPTKPVLSGARSVRYSSSSTSSSSSHSDSDSDDAPLATLVGPKRPGSAASSAPSSASRPRVLPKPLIDISTIAPLTPSSIFDSDRPPVPAKESPQLSPQIITPSHALKPSLNDRLTRLAKSAGSGSERDSGDIEREPGRSRGIPTRSQTTPLESLPARALDPPSPSPIGQRKTNGRSMSSPNAAEEARNVNLSNSAPIIPMPIRTRTPPPAFAVTSRPSSQVSQSSQDQSGPRVSEETVRGARSRTVTLLSEGGLASSKGFTGGGLLAGSSAQSPPSGPSRARQRSSTMISAPLPSIDSSQSLLSSPDAHSRTGARLPQASSSKDLQSSRLPNRPSSPASNKSAATGTPPSASRSTFMPKSAMKSSSSSQASLGIEDSRPRSSKHAALTAPRKPFAGTSYTVALRGNSPTSSTGDSSSGRTPITPVDSGDFSSSASAKKRGHRKTPSVTFDEPDRGRPGVREREKAEASDTQESKTRERRRSEAKAALELGKIVNGRGPIVTDDDEGIPMNMGPRMNMFNPMMPASTGMSSMGSVNVIPPSPMTWTSPQASQGMMNPMMMNGPGANANPAFLAAHQQAMMVAKQAFQMAVAQQALAAANEEWERGSTAASAYGGFGGMGGAGMGGGMTPAYGMNGMNMGMNMGMGMPWGMQMFPSSQSMYAGSVIGGSELGVNTPVSGRLGGGAGWGSRTAYGEQGGYTGSAAERASMAYRNSQFLGGGGGGGGARSEMGGPTSPRGGQRPRTKTNPSDAPLPSPHAKNRGGPPPSSWNTRHRPA